MRTNELIEALAVGVAPIDRAGVARRFHAKLAGGVLLALGAVLVSMGTRPDLADATALPMFWLKLLFPASLSGVALVCLRRLSHPGMRLGAAPAAVVLPVALVWTLAGAALLAVPEGARLPLVFGSTWLACLMNIALLSIPAFGLAFWAARELAPTRLRLTGAAAGLFAGGAAAFAYGLHCPEMQAPFLAVWGELGMAVPVGLGAWLGPRLLRW